MISAGLKSVVAICLAAAIFAVLASPFVDLPLTTVNNAATVHQHLAAALPQLSPAAVPEVGVSFPPDSKYPVYWPRGQRLLTLECTLLC